MQLAKVLQDSISPSGARLTTLEVKIPRCLQAELNTHRVLSKNSASSRAIPGNKMISMVGNTPYVPSFGAAGSGMQDHGDLPQHLTGEAQVIWYRVMAQMQKAAEELLDLGVHKQYGNRLLEPFMWQTILVTGTDWANFLNLRCHKDTHKDFQATARAIGEVLRDSEPEVLDVGDWHTPLIREDELDLLDLETRKKVSVARCARVSYLTHDGRRDVSADLRLYERLLKGSHMSPFEHVARPENELEGELGTTRGNFFGWVQYRQEIPYEWNPHGFEVDECPAQTYGVVR